MSDVIKILSIDGGGIRGLIPAVVLAEIEKRTGKPVSELFDVIAGTSTGGILALGLTCPAADGRPRYSAERLIDLYQKEGKRIFNRSRWRRFFKVDRLVEEKYDEKGIEGVLKEYFGETRLKDALTDVIVSSYDIWWRRSWFFKSRDARDKDRDHPMWEVARSTSAAPTYFEPHTIGRQGKDDFLALVDGGVFANNPGLCALAEAAEHHGRDADVMLLSLGTGELTRSIDPREAEGWGLLEWAQPILGIMFDGMSDAVHYQLRQLLKPKEGGAQRYFRLQPRLYIGNDDMDDTSETNLAALVRLAHEMIADRESEIRSACDLLVK